MRAGRSWRRAEAGPPAASLGEAAQGYGGVAGGGVGVVLALAVAVAVAAEVAGVWWWNGGGKGSGASGGSARSGRMACGSGIRVGFGRGEPGTLVVLGGFALLARSPRLRI